MMNRRALNKLFFSWRRGLRFGVAGACLAIVVLGWIAPAAPACPFCTAVGPSLAERRERATAVALGEVLTSTEEARRYRLHRVLKGADTLSDPDVLDLPPEAGAVPGGLALLFAETVDDGTLTWTAIPAAEVAVGYFFAAPDLRVGASERLRFFARYLEHSDPLLADDAFREFSRAGLDDVASVADLLDFVRLRAWLADPAVAAERKGFYGLALGLATHAPTRQENLEFLREHIARPQSDFRAGFDGQLGGFLLLGGAEALDDITARLLANPRAAVGDVRHAMTALRFYRQYGREIPADRLAAALRHVLARPEFAEQAIADLARWEDWESLPAIGGLWGQPGYDTPETQRAIVGYLCVCPGEDAREVRDRIRRQEPQLVAEVEARLALDSDSD
jgi:hypothetical protein